MSDTPTPGHLAYVIALARRYTPALGFLPRPRLEQYARQGRLWLATEAGDPCGYLVLGNGWPVLNLYQVCIQEDAQRRTHGSALLARALRYAQAQGYAALGCWCAEDLEANQFWHANGFQRAGMRRRPNRRQRAHVRWVRAVPVPLQTRLWEAAGPERPSPAPRAHADTQRGESLARSGARRPS